MKKKTANEPKDWVSTSLRDNPELRRAFEIEQANAEFVEQVHFLLERQGVTQAELAKRCNVSGAAISKILSGSQNLQLGTMAQLASALQHELHVILRESTAGIGRLFLTPLTAAETPWSTPAAKEITVSATSSLGGWPATSSPRDVEFTTQTSEPLVVDGEPASQAGWSETLSEVVP